MVVLSLAKVIQRRRAKADSGQEAGSDPNAIDFDQIDVGVEEERGYKVL